MSNSNKYMAKYVNARYLKLKLRLIEYKGSKCKICGYNKCYAALSLHHTNPMEKEFEWRYLRKRSWNTILKEADKCDLVCNNCHAELHVDNKTISETLKWLNDRKKKPAKDHGFAICMYCGKEFKKNHDNRKCRYCCKKCYDKAQEWADYPPDDEFITLVDKIGQSATGRKFGVSARSIKKRYDKIKNILI